DVLYVIDPLKNWRRMFVDAKLGRVAFEEKVSELPGMPGVMRLTYADFQLVAGIPVPKKTVLSVKGKTVIEVNLTQIKANAPVDQGLFKLESK
ncbi:MAG TPA: hypothetical protein PKK12_14665, partial [Candidatus Aminicenantes bacterium]|nr:hypothetical protein [Candidatus Aminicenantes bacterium]